MNDAQLIDWLSGTDAYAADVPIPDEIWTPAIALHEIERRTGMQTDERRVQEVGETLAPKPQRRKSIMPALAGAAAVLVIALGGWVLINDGSDVAARTPLEVAEALDAAIVAGDWEAVLGLYAEDATYTHVDDGFGFDPFRHGRDPADYSIRTDMPLTSERFTSGPGLLPGQYSEPLTNLYPNPEWDGEPGVTGFDDLATLAMASYAAGVTDFYSCEQADSTTVVCEVVIAGDAFWDAPPPVTDTFTVDDGLITHQLYDTTTVLSDDPTGSNRLNYLGWIEGNRPELETSLFAQSESPGRLRVTPDNFETHRELIAEWRAQR